MGNLSIEQRNSLVEQYLWCIDRVIWQNGSLIRAAHLDKEDVYQSLAARLIRAVELYDPEKKAGGSLKGYIFMSLRYEMRTCSSARAQYGLGHAPHYLPHAVTPISALEESDPYWQMRIAA